MSRRQVTSDFRDLCHARTVPWMSNDHFVFFRPWLALRPFYLKCCVGGSVSLLCRVKFICPAGDPSSCAMVVLCRGTSKAFCSSDEPPPAYTHPSTNTFFKVSTVGIQFTYNRLSETLFPFLWGSQVLVWHHCHHVLTSS